MPLRPSGGGEGFYGASRGEARSHTGYDIATQKLDDNARNSVGTEIFSPIDGKLTISLTKDKKFSQYTIVGTGVYEGYTVGLAYVNPKINSNLFDNEQKSNTFVSKGQFIGRSVDLNTSTTFFQGQNAFGILPGRVEGYPDSVQDHVHFSIRKDGKNIDPTPGVVITYITLEKLLNNE